MRIRIDPGCTERPRPAGGETPDGRSIERRVTILDMFAAQGNILCGQIPNLRDDLLAGPAVNGAARFVIHSRLF